MILQHILFSDIEVCDVNELFYRGENLEPDGDFTSLTFQEEGMAAFDTYYNSFPLEKWKKYTYIGNLSLSLIIEGDFYLEVKEERLSKKQMSQKTLIAKRLTTSSKEEMIIPIPIREGKGLITFYLKALKGNSKFFGGSYTSELENTRYTPPNLAINLKASKDSYKLNRLLNRLVMEGAAFEKDYKCENIEIFISGSAEGRYSIEKQRDNFHFCKGRDLGTAGYYVEGLLDIFKSDKSDSFTHLLFIKDDILLAPDALYRTLAFMASLRGEHTGIILGGTKLDLFNKSTTISSGSYWSGLKNSRVKEDYNLTDFKQVLKLQKEDTVNNWDWSYCLFPMDMIHKDNLPLPLHYKEVDTEYSLRNGYSFLGLSGVAYYIDKAESETATYSPYYDIRNSLIINALHRPSFGYKQLQNHMKSYVLNNISMYRFNYIHLYLMGIRDFLKGEKWLKELEGEAYHSMLRGYSETLTPIENLNFKFSYKAYEKQLKFKDNRNKRLKRKLTLSGWLLPANKSIILPLEGGNAKQCFRVKRILYYEEGTNRGYITKKSYIEVIRAYRAYLQVRREVKKNFASAAKSYGDNQQSLMRSAFWQDLLNRRSGEVEYKAPPRKSKAGVKTTAKRAVMHGRTMVLRFLQHFLFWYPVKKNRVLLYIYSRRGYTCNPKYIAEALMEKYGDSLDICIASDFPDTIRYLEERGFVIVDRKSMDFVIKNFTSKVIVTNDQRPEFIVKRRKQYLINTWHASCAYKKVGLAVNMDKGYFVGKRYEYWHKGTDFVPSGAQVFTECMPESLALPKGVFENVGSARNDIFFRDNQKLKEKIFKEYNLPLDTKVVIYAPTFRNLAGGKGSTYGMNFNLLLKSLEERFGGSWVCFFRAHYFYKANIKVVNVIDVTDYEDMQELLAVVDVLVTDYSSCIWDYSITKKPSFVYAPDLATYMSDDRGFYTPIAEWPYPLTKSNEELRAAILSFDEEEYKKKVLGHHEVSGICESGNASELIADRIYEKCYGSKKDKSPGRL